MKAPKHLKHKPIIEVPNYEKKEPFATDAMALSLGRSQYSDGNDFSAKVWRKPGMRWSRQSEELPFHRVLDLSILVLKSIIDSKTSETVSQQTILEENICDASSLKNLHDYINTNIKHYEIRINELQALLLIYNKI